MVSSGFFTPFNESPRIVRVQITSTMTGSITTDIDAYRQGIEITNESQRNKSTLPRLEADDNDHQLAVTVLGQSNEFTANVTFNEITKFNPLAFIQNSDTLTYPVILDSPSYEDPELFGGYIEPLAITSRNFLIENAEFEPHSIRGDLVGGNLNSFKKSDLIVTYFDMTETRQTADVYIDAADNVGAMSGSVAIIGIFPDDERIISPFNESLNTTKCLRSGILTGDADEIKTALASMSSDTENYIAQNHISLCTGFVYGDSTFGTDSIAFGGLKR